MLADRMMTVAGDSRMSAVSAASTDGAEAVLVKGGNIISVEYNAENASGFIKSWDNAYIQTMLHTNGTDPNEYTCYYASQLLEGQGEGSIDAITGASSSHGAFQVLEQARRGDSSMVFVDTAH